MFPALSGRPGPGRGRGGRGAVPPRRQSISSVRRTTTSAPSSPKEVREVVRERVVRVHQQGGPRAARLREVDGRLERLQLFGTPVLGGRVESATMPAPACRRATPSERTIVRIAMHVRGEPGRKSVADGAGVRAAAVALELADDLHRPHLRRPRDRTRGEAGAEQVERPSFPSSVAGDLGDEMGDVGELLGLEQPLDVTDPEGRRGRGRSGRGRRASRARRAPSRRRAAARRPRGRVRRPRDRVRRSRGGPRDFTSVSGRRADERDSPSSSRKRYGEGLTRRSAR